VPAVGLTSNSTPVASSRFITVPTRRSSPSARHTFEFVEFVLAVVKTNGFDLGNLICKLQLVRFQLVMEFPSSEEILQKSTIGNFDLGTFRRLFEY